MKETLLFAVIMTIIDTIWIRTFMYPKYKAWFRSLNLRMDIKILSIIFAYATMVIVYPLFIKNKDSKRELLNAALIGGIIFALYGFTVAGIFPNYGLDFAFTEVIWGVILYTSTTYILQKILSIV